MNFMRSLPAVWVLLCCFTATARCDAATAVATQAARPNIVVILVDDLGWADLGCYGSSFYRTPNIDRLASRGMRFTDAYAAGPVCSPTRAAILTGKHPARLHLTDWLPGRPDQPGQKLARPAIAQALPTNEVTLAEALKPAGYVSASVGKWHLGGEGSSPLDHGFDINVGGDHAGSPASYFSPYKNSRGEIPGLTGGEPQEYLTDRLTAEAVRFMEQNRAAPFFLYLSHYAVHIPLAAKQSLVESYQNRAVTGQFQTNAVYAAMIESLDEGVGGILRKLEELQLADRTLIIFSSDNGGLSVKEGPLTPATSNDPLRAGKGYLYEGGVRVPLIVSWPGRTRPGSTCNVAVNSLDLFPTVLEVATGNAGQGADGLSLVSLLDGKESWPQRNLFWHYPHYSNQGGKPGSAVRAGAFKLIQFLEDERVELYDLGKDPGEANNIANQQPEKVLALQESLRAWRQAMGAQSMTTNPRYAAAQDKSSSSPLLVKQADDGTILLHARDVTIHGSRVRYEPPPQKNTVGYWTKLDDWISWEFEVRKPGGFNIQILQGCGPGSGGSEVEFSVAGRTFPVTVQETRGFQDFIPRVIGRVELQPGRYTLTVKPKTKPGLAVMDLRSVTLLYGRE